MLSNMSACSCVTDLSRQKKASFFFFVWAGIGGVMALILNDDNACAELRQMMLVTGIGLSAFSICYLANCVFCEKFFPFLCLSTLFFVASMDVILIYTIYSSGDENALVSKDCSDDDRKLPWFMISWLSLFVLLCPLLCICNWNSEDFFSQRSEATQGEFQTLLL